MRLGDFAFRPGLWPSLAALFFFGLTLWLGDWQLSRAEYKRSLQAHYDRMQMDGAVRLGDAIVDKQDVLHRTVEVRGSFVPGEEIFIDNRMYKTLAGYHVYSPFAIEGSALHVLVNRGWIGLADGRRDVLPEVRAIPGVVALRGVAVDTASRYFEFKGAQPQGRLWQNLDFERYSRQFGRPLQPILVEQTSDTGDGLVRDWPRPDTGMGTHVSYAIQWFGLAAAVMVLWLVLNVKRKTVAEEET